MAVVQPSTFHLRRRTPGSFVLVPFDRQGRSIRCQGQLEAAAAVVLANCPLVRSIREQPLSIQYAWRETSEGVQFQLLDEAAGAKERRCRKDNLCVTHIVPDFLVEMQDASHYLLEIKPARKLQRPDVRRKQAVATAYAQSQGWRYRILTERQLFHGPLLANLRLLNRYRRSVCDPRLLDQLVDHISTESVTTGEPVITGDLIRRCGGSFPTPSIRAALFHLLSSGRLDCDPRSGPLNDDTLIFSGGTIAWDPFDSVWGPSGCATDVSSVSSSNWQPTASLSSTSSFTASRR